MLQQYITTVDSTSYSNELCNLKLVVIAVSLVCVVSKTHFIVYNKKLGTIVILAYHVQFKDRRTDLPK